MSHDGWGVQIDGGWFHEETHRYRCTAGYIRPSATQVFEILGMSDFSAISPLVVEWKRNYGQAVHAAGQFLATGDLDWDTVDDAIIPAATGIEMWLKKYEFICEGTEELKIRTLFGMQYGTRLDLRGSLMYHGRRRNVIVDYKTGSKKSKTWDWQLGSYYVDQPKVEGGWIGVILQIDMDGTVEPHWVLDLEKEKREFQVLLASAILKINNGFVKLAA